MPLLKKKKNGRISKFGGGWSAEFGKFQTFFFFNDGFPKLVKEEDFNNPTTKENVMSVETF